MMPMYEHLHAHRLTDKHCSIRLQLGNNNISLSVFQKGWEKCSLEVVAYLWTCVGYHCRSDVWELELLHAFDLLADFYEGCPWIRPCSCKDLILFFASMIHFSLISKVSFNFRFSSLVFHCSQNILVQLHYFLGGKFVMSELRKQNTKFHGSIFFHPHVGGIDVRWQFGFRSWRSKSQVAAGMRGM